MADEKDILDYLSKGGKFSAPGNAPARYRAELLRMMASFVDSEMAGAAYATNNDRILATLSFTNNSGFFRLSSEAP